jgi:hypothetical protein
MESRSDFIVGLVAHIGCVPNLRGNDVIFEGCDWLREKRRCHKLGIKESTVHEHIRRVYDKPELRSTLYGPGDRSFSITSSDEGRPISDFSHQLEYDDPINDCSRVLSDHFASSRGAIENRFGYSGRIGAQLGQPITTRPAQPRQDG